MRILITNDDGINAPGLVTLTKIATELARYLSPRALPSCGGG